MNYRYITAADVANLVNCLIDMLTYVVSRKILPFHVICIS